ARDSRNPVDRGNDRSGDRRHARANEPVSAAKPGPGPAGFAGRSTGAGSSPARSLAGNGGPGEPVADRSAGGIALGELRDGLHEDSSLPLPRWAAEQIGKVKRQSDVAGHYGPHGFMLLLAQTT